MSLRFSSNYNLTINDYMIIIARSNVNKKVLMYYHQYFLRNCTKYKISLYCFTKYSWFIG
ncbi:hypothetical protein A1OE_693 [Candidatus Endolissoclinum faulkneri L2]|uniref:Uncharacterized protein n=1 Tax=Candidatus Endolissoclinum faulkneri L2 TaxID=1193729 RepID=K7ZCT1_9PROT|nr:hypothetical protein A1OE_693 [Candidatus Endolissoclinum faulkneri L2]